MDKLIKYIDQFDTDRAAAVFLNVSPAAISLWRSGQRGISPHKAQDIEKRTGGIVKAIDLVYVFD
jgi:DNA-binding transcriptional regulator YdaS (Cro superfamily)